MAGNQCVVLATRGVPLRSPTREVGMSTSLGSTATPGRTCCRPLTITRSPGFRPSVDLPQPVVQRPQPDRAGDDLVLLVDDVEDLLALVGVDGAVADQQGPVG